jgi:tRNA A37 threonylcarbamoyladenosine synthetase subunit TsaC/SUA5/YrdC
MTIVVKSNPAIVPNLITAQTGFVGVRVPNHEVALELLRATDRPIAAPSANKFGHVSPTKASHVLNDFKNDDVTILDGGSCPFGIESTVLKLQVNNEGNPEVMIFRRGGIS